MLPLCYLRITSVPPTCPLCVTPVLLEYCSFNFLVQAPYLRRQFFFHSFAFWVLGTTGEPEDRRSAGVNGSLMLALRATIDVYTGRRSRTSPSALPD